jgi:hypothetical protein
MEPEIDKPTVVTALRLFGWISVVGSPIIAIAVAGTSNMAGAPGTMLVVVGVMIGVFWGTVLFAFAAIVVKLCEIEMHLRPREQSQPPSSHSRMSAGPTTTTGQIVG